MSSKRKNTSSQEPRPPDRTTRCKQCFAGPAVYGQPEVGTVMVKEIIRLQKDDGPNTDVAHTVRCIRCGYVSDVVIWRAGAELGITREAVFSLLRESKATPSFSMEELRSGKLWKPQLSPALQEALAKPARPTFGMDYNPDQHIEPRSMPAPIPQEMF